jgi:hypothetical protein
MPRIRSLASQSPAIAIAMVALVFSLGGGAYAAGLSQGHAAIPAGKSAPAFQWHKLSLTNGWKALGAGTYGAPSYAIKDGTLYLSGILAAPKGQAKPEFAKLPSGARPKHFLWLSFLNFGEDSLGELEIEPSGAMSAYSTTDGGPLIDPSLATISFPLSS